MHSLHRIAAGRDFGFVPPDSFYQEVIDDMLLLFSIFITQDDALLIVSIAKRAVEVSGDMRRPGVHGKVAGLIKDKVEQGLGLGGWQCIVGQKGTFGCCLAPAPNNYFNFDLPTVTVLMFKAT